jgi:protein disulfide-isomerase
MKNRSLLLALCLFVAGVCVAQAAKPGWSENFAEAKTQATAQKKHLLLDFTGSDWCGWCIKIDKEVFAKPEFKELGDKKLVLVEVDFPKAIPQTPAIKAQNEGLERKYKVNGYPTLVLLDPNGKEVKRWEGFHAAFLEELKKEVGGN